MRCATCGQALESCEKCGHQLTAAEQMEKDGVHPDTCRQSRLPSSKFPTHRYGPEPMSHDEKVVVYGILVSCGLFLAGIVFGWAAVVHP